jgi:hypothetical protein
MPNTPSLSSRFRNRDAFHEFRLSIGRGEEPEPDVVAYLQSQGVDTAGLGIRIREMLGQ